VPTDTQAVLDAASGARLVLAGAAVEPEARCRGCDRWHSDILLAVARAVRIRKLTAALDRTA
jgi:hypothetical protein